MKKIGTVAKDANGVYHLGELVPIEAKTDNLYDTVMKTPDGKLLYVNYRTVTPAYVREVGENLHTGLFDSDGREILLGDVVRIVHTKWGYDEEDGIAVAYLELSSDYRYKYMLKYDALYSFTFNQNVLTAKYGDGTDFCKKPGEYCESHIVGHFSDPEWTYKRLHNFKSVNELD